MSFLSKAHPEGAQEPESVPTSDVGGRNDNCPGGIDLARSKGRPKDIRRPCSGKVLAWRRGGALYLAGLCASCGAWEREQRDALKQGVER